MRRKVLVTLISLLVLATLTFPTHAQVKKPKIGFLPGVVDPFYQVMEIGVNEAVADFGLQVVTQYPQGAWGPTNQTPVLDAMVARGDLNYLIIAPTDKEAMVAPLQRAVDAGIKVITVDTFLGDGDYVNGKVTFPLSYIGSDNVEGGRIAAQALGKVLNGKGKVYIQNTTVGTSTTEQRGQGFKEGIAKFPDMQLVGMDYNQDDAGTAAQQVAAKLQANPDLAGIFGVNVFSALGAGNTVKAAGLGGKVQIIAFDATKDAIENLRSGVVSLVIAQKPHDMGYLAVEFAMADVRGVTSIPRHVTTGYAVIDAKNVDDPNVAKFIYQVGK
ncbi:MAG TPA: ABC transporter substrate-binding protein [Aggregatilineaceae bacterium]|nr:ABC transporter substrate-binding protein [Aggregatilineaceae bacterium]